jgi:hypothetical protein
VPYLKLISCGDIFPAIPPTGSWFKREEINCRGNGKNDPPDQIVYSLEIIHLKGDYTIKIDRANLKHLSQPFFERHCKLTVFNFWS